MLPGAEREIGAVGVLIVEDKVEVPLDELGTAAGEAADIEEVEAGCFFVKLYFGPSSFSDESRRLRRRSASSSRSS